VRKSRTLGSVRGAPSNGRPYRDHRGLRRPLNSNLEGQPLGSRSLHSYHRFGLEAVI
jgi:hypothetical protein